MVSNRSMAATVAAIGATTMTLFFTLTMPLPSNSFTVRPYSSSSSFCGNTIVDHSTNSKSTSSCPPNRLLTMRKQKASDRRTRRLQRGILEPSNAATSTGTSTASATTTSTTNTQNGVPPFPSNAGLTTSPMATATWQHKSIDPTLGRANVNANVSAKHGKGRGRSRKRLQLYNSLASYHAEFLNLLTAEYRVEEAEVLGRIEASLDNPLALEEAGHAIFDIYPTRRGNLFSDEVYRLAKARDATTIFSNPNNPTETSNSQISSQTQQTQSLLPPNSKFSQNDAIVLTLQPNGSGDFFTTSTLPTNRDATILEARVLNVGPTYVDVAIPAGAFESAFGPAPNHNDAGNSKSGSKRGDKTMRLRADRFVSDVSYRRMVQALGRMTSVPPAGAGTGNAAATPVANAGEGKETKEQLSNSNSSNNSKPSKSKQQTKMAENICMDNVLRQVILSTYGYQDPSSPMYQDLDACNLSELSKRLARPPLPNSTKLANQVLGYLQSNPQQIFPNFNGPQLSAIGAALTRRLTMIQGPPGTGKTTVAASIAFGFVHQCREISPRNKVLACAFSNVGADNLAEALLAVGLKVVRVGAASAVSPSLWDRTLDAAIARDPEAKKAAERAVKVSSDYNVKRVGGGGGAKSKVDAASARNRREAATIAVKASIEAANIAATKAIREADVIVCTSIGAADSRLLAACGMIPDDEEGDLVPDREKDENGRKLLAPDNLPSLSLPYVIIDEACQSVEPATLVPIVSSNSCRSLVLLGDPCQLPPTVLSDASGIGSSPLSQSLMGRLASTLPHPVIVTAKSDETLKTESFLRNKHTQRAASLVRYRNTNHAYTSNANANASTSAAEGGKQRTTSYRRRYSGSLLLSVQYRMHPSISAFSSAVFYDGLLATPALLSETRPLPLPLRELLPTEDAALSVRFVNVGGRNNEQRGDSSFRLNGGGAGENTSYRNKAEAIQIITVLKELLSSSSQDGQRKFQGSIGIVTPYSSQVALLKSTMASDAEIRSLLTKQSQVSIEINSVDAYQGRERDIIMFSAVRSNRRGSIGFLEDWRRMNVALTRAKSGLVVFGDLDTLKEGDAHWEAFGNWCEGVGCVFDVNSQANNE